MAKSQKHGNKVVQNLLDERRRIERWLERLSMTADQTSEGVRTRVERDYRARLEKVLEELEGHRDGIARTLERHRKDLQESAEKEAKASEELSEAELRHAVGEYDESEWTKVRTDILETLVKLREDIKKAQEEIDALEEVLASFEQAADVEADDVEIPDVPDVDLDDDDEPDEGEVPALDIDEPRKPKKRGGQTDAFDELAFLKSVTEDEEKGPSPERASGVQRAITDADVTAKADEKGKKKKEEEETPIGASGIRPIEAESQPAKGTAKRTLKCAECGKMNLPTEWYCENCGAELAAL